jgi:hypothetical protein
MAVTITTEAVFQSGFPGQLESLDPRVRYPSYKSLDEFIDLERLKGLDDFVTERICQHMQSDSVDYFVNAHRLNEDEPYKPGQREIWLSRTLPGTPYDYLDLDHTELWQRTSEAGAFTPLMEFIETLPFSATGRILIIYDDSGAAVPAHRDHTDTSICNEFIWFRTNLRKPFYMLYPVTGEKSYVESYTAWFDSVNQYHGCDGAKGLTFSMRVDGIFTEKFRSEMPVPFTNPASKPSLWACIA